MDWQFAQDLLQQYGYLIIIGWTFLEGETIVIIAGFLAQQGMFDLHPLYIAICAFIGSFCSDQFMFCLGKYKGPAVLKRFPRLNKNTEKARRLIVKYETALILGFRFVYGIRNVTPIMLGISGVRHIKFIILNMIGAAVWAFTFSYGGYFFGELFEQFSGHIKSAEKWIIGGVIVVALALYLRHRIRAKKARLASQAGNHATGQTPPPAQDEPEALPHATTQQTNTPAPNDTNKTSPAGTTHKDV